LRKAIEAAAHADNRLCWTCNSISGLQKLAVDEGFVDKTFPCRWKIADKTLYPFLLFEIYSMFGFSPQ
jgi:hypothetical protein